jgi:RNA polymerase sigma factor (sigma-70 family)
MIERQRGRDLMPSDERVSALFRSAEPRAEAMAEGEVSDSVLLRRFIDHWDQAAFRELVCRHGPMVLGVCKRILADADAAEDAFQATFLLLVRKACSVRKLGSVGAWLHGVAHRVSLEARGAALRRRAHLSLDPEAIGVDDHDSLDRDELHAALHEELGLLPEKYRAPMVLCYIEGLSHEAVARQLAWPIGTVRGRIARGRDLLGARLVRRGLVPSAILLALSLLPKTAVAVPVRLVETTVRSAARVAAGEGVAGGGVSGRVANLEERVGKAMHLTRLKWATAAALTVVASGVGVAAVLPAAVAFAEDTAKTMAELKKLKGTWVEIASEQAGEKKQAVEEHQIKFDGESFELIGFGEVAMKGTLKVDASKTPMEIDLKFEQGKVDGTTALAIYTWDGENLKLCAVHAGSGERPTNFTTKAGDHRMLMVFKRQAP